MWDTKILLCKIFVSDSLLRKDFFPETVYILNIYLEWKVKLLSVVLYKKLWVILNFLLYHMLRLQNFSS